MDGSFAQAFRVLIDEQVRRNHEVVEHACELMLVLPGSRGVLVRQLENGCVSAELSEDVPFGEIHYI